jgi:hypothetical protein
VNRRDFLAAAVAVPYVLSRAPRAALALVTADLESKVVVVRLADCTIRGSIRTPAYPRSIETVGAHAVVGHPEIGAATILDAQTLAVAHVLHGFGEPRYTAADPDGRHAYVTDAKRGEVVALDVLRGRLVGRAAVGSLARHVSIEPAGRTLWVALGSKVKEVAIVDVSRPAEPRLVRRFVPPFSRARRRLRAGRTARVGQLREPVRARGLRCPPRASAYPAVRRLAAPARHAPMLSLVESGKSDVSVGRRRERARAGHLRTTR